MDPKIIKVLFDKEKIDSLKKILDHLHDNVFTEKVMVFDNSTLGIVDLDFMEEIKVASKNLRISFGKTLKDFKLILNDKNLRAHEICMKYKSPGRLSVSHVNFPRTNLEDREYSTIEEAVCVFQKHINSLTTYFFELESIDSQLTVAEPLNPSFRDNYRHISLDDQTWLRVEVTPHGLPTKLKIIGESDIWAQKLHDKMKSWNYEKSIFENLMELSDSATSSYRSLQVNFDEPSDFDSAEIQVDMPSGIQTDTSTEFQADIPAGIQTDTSTEFQANISADIPAGIQTDNSTEFQADISADIPAGIQTDTSTEFQADLSSDIPAGIQTDTSTEFQADLSADIPAGIQTDTSTEFQADIQDDIHTETHTNIHTETQTDTQGDFQTETQAEIHTETQIKIHIDPPVTIYTESQASVSARSCSICLCVELVGNAGVPQPICQNVNCRQYFHRNCLYQWLISCEGGRLPIFGVVSGTCPSCDGPITCLEPDN